MPRVVETDVGPGRLHVHRARGPIARLLVSHGAGRDSETPDLMALARVLPRHGITVARFDQPWVVARRKVATPPPTLDVGLRAAAAAFGGRGPLLVGGRSAGARSACRCAHELGAVGVVALSFPLHPPGRPESSRLPELTGAGVPRILVQGERDPMGRPEEFPADVGDSPDALVVVPAADHGLIVPKRAGIGQDDAMTAMAEQVARWVTSLIGE